MTLGMAAVARIAYFLIDVLWIIGNNHSYYFNVNACRGLAPRDARITINRASMSLRRQAGSVVSFKKSHRFCPHIN